MIGTPNGGADMVTMIATAACLKCADLDTIMIGTPYGIDMGTMIDTFDSAAMGTMIGMPDGEDNMIDAAPDDTHLGTNY